MEYTSFDYNIEELEKSALFSDAVIENLLSIKDNIERTRTEQLLIEHAEKLKCKAEFKQLLKAYKKEHKQKNMQDFDLVKIGTQILKENNIVRLEDDQLYFYNDYYYNMINKQDRNFDNMMRDYCESISTANKNNLIDYLKDRARTITTNDLNKYKQYIAVGNGIFDLRLNRLITEPKPDIICTNKIDINYKDIEQEIKDLEFAKSINNITEEEEKTLAEEKDAVTLLDKTLNDIFMNNQEQIKLFYEYIGYCLYSGTEFNKMLILKGNGANGKSILIKLIENLLGMTNINTEKIQKLSTDKFAVYNLYNKLANIDDDASKSFIEESSMIKNLTDGNMIQAEQKGVQKFNFKPKAKLIMTCNDQAKINDTTYGLERRLIIVKLKNSFTPEKGNLNINLAEELNNIKVLELLLYRACLEFNQVLLCTHEFTIDAEAKADLKEFLESNNKILNFIPYLEEAQAEHPKMNYTIADNCYVLFKEYLADNGYTDRYGKITFYAEMQKQNYEFIEKSTKNIQYIDTKGVMQNKRTSLLIKRENT